MPLADQHARSGGFLLLRQHAGRRPALLPGPYPPRLSPQLARGAGLVACLKFPTAHHLHRHCERQRSNPCRSTKKEWIASSLSLLAITKDNSLGLPIDASAAFIFVRELSRKVIGKGSYLERRATARRVDSVQLDPIKLIVGKDRDDLACLELGPAHPSRGDGYSEPCFGAGNDAVG